MSVRFISKVTGPVPADVFRDLVGLPAGEAARRICQYDPMYGLPDDAEIEWLVRLESRATIIGYARVMAPNQRTAMERAKDLPEGEVDKCDAETDAFDWEAVSAKPAAARSLSPGHGQLAFEVQSP